MVINRNQCLAYRTLDGASLFGCRIAHKHHDSISTYYCDDDESRDRTRYCESQYGKLK